MKKTLFLLLATCSILSLAAQENTQNPALIKHNEVLITKKTAAKGAKLVGLGAIVLASAYTLYTSIKPKYSFTREMSGTAWINIESKMCKSNDQLISDAIISSVASYAAYSALAKAIKIIKS